MSVSLPIRNNFMNPWKQGFFLTYEHCALLSVVKMLGVRYNKRHNREFKRIRYEKEVRFYVTETDCCRCHSGRAAACAADDRFRAAGEAYRRSGDDPQPCNGL
ncbi:hypothetical protein HOLDEFILI_04095 [Holdemania filiformis DSM 12042]|uniref:Uncharacterized protein n=1 Tax=Holdemania filiformis DSM 12042 TaxID=545696 RepID=B9YE21_9FIRM|nr:hypothetical protein HOLDEFILI_04095 [Holdemania filiformis DSM 12042]